MRHAVVLPNLRLGDQRKDLHGRGFQQTMALLVALGDDGESDQRGCEVGDLASVLCRDALDDPQFSPILLRWHLEREPPVAVRAAELEHARPHTAEPDRWRLLPIWPEPQDRAFKAPDPPLVIDGPIGGPQEANDLEGLLQPTDRLVWHQSVWLGVQSLAGTESEDNAPMADMVEGQELLRQH